MANNSANQHRKAHQNAHEKTALHQINQFDIDEINLPDSSDINFENRGQCLVSETIVAK